MTKTQIREKLKEIGIDTDNVYSKFILASNGQEAVSLFEDEFVTDFYFHHKDLDKIFKIKATSKYKEMYETEIHYSALKYLVPASEWEEVIFPKAEREYTEEFVEQEDDEMKKMTLRDYASIQLGTAQSNKKWLNELITKSKIYSK